MGLAVVIVLKKCKPRTIFYQFKLMLFQPGSVRDPKLSILDPDPNLDPDPTCQVITDLDLDTDLVC